jgi:hypothetical protein
MRRPIALAALCVSVVACGGGVDQQKFDAVYKAGNALQAEVQSSGTAPRPEARDRLKEFDVAIEALRNTPRKNHGKVGMLNDLRRRGRLPGILRFRALDPEEGTTQIVLKGPNIEVATRYKLPVDTRGGTKYVNRAQAITILLQAAEQHLNDGNRILKGR